MAVICLIIAGISGGLIGGMGMGGGTLLIPLLTLFCNFSQHAAQGTNLISFIPMAAISLALHAKNGLLRMKYLPSIALPAAAASIAASFAAMKFDGELLGKVFGCFLIVVGTLSFVEAVFVKKETEALPLLLGESKKPFEKNK